MYTFVTSFAKQHYDLYAEKMLQSVAANWSPDVNLIVYVEGYDSTDELPLANFSSNIEYRHIEEIEARNNFVTRNKESNGIINGNQYNYRFDAVRFSNKVYAYSEVAFELLNEVEENRGWLVWIDADTITTNKLNKKELEKILPNDYDVVHLGRIDIDYSETGFLGFNLDMHNAASLVVDIRGAYDIDEVFGYREWTDSFVFERLLKIYKAHGTKALNLSEGKKGLAVFEQSILSNYFIHNKGNLKFNTEKENTISKDVNAGRHNQLASIIKQYSKGKDKFSIVETGTWNGGRAIQMALCAFENTDHVHYHGFDLFEEASDETDKKELNVKKHNSEELVGQRLGEFATRMQEQNKTFTFELSKGNTNKTLKDFSTEGFNFCFIDGGHSIETVKNDYHYLKDIPVIVFDDFYASKEGKEIPEEHGGVKAVFDTISDKERYVLFSQDPTAFGATVHLAIAVDTNVEEVLDKNLLKRPIIVTPKDCMPSDYIQNNIIHNTKAITNYSWIKPYKPVSDHVIIVSGGKVDFDEVRRVQEEHNAQVWCVKHSYPKLLKEGIQPYACVILDPRSIEGMSTHGIKRTKLFRKIEQDTLFIIASMTDISVVNYIMKKTKNILGFHAYTDAIRDPSFEKKVKVVEGLGIKEGELLISGGTCAATRAISLLEVLGYTQIHMFGFDCSYDNITEEQLKKIDDEGRPAYFKVETAGKEFVTTGELLALAQDLEKMFSRRDLKINIRFYGKDTLASAVWETSWMKNEYKTFKEAKIA